MKFSQRKEIGNRQHWQHHRNVLGAGCIYSQEYSETFQIWQNYPGSILRMQMLKSDSLEAIIQWVLIGDEGSAFWNNFLLWLMSNRVEFLICYWIRMEAKCTASLLHAGLALLPYNLKTDTYLILNFAIFCFSIGNKPNSELLGVENKICGILVLVQVGEDVGGSLCTNLHVWDYKYKPGMTTQRIKMLWGV